MKFNMCTWGIHISMRIPRTVRQNEVEVSLCTRQKGVERIWDFKGEISNSQVAKKVANIFLLGHSETMGQGSLVNRLLHGPFLSYFIHLCQREYTNVIMLKFPS